MYAVVSVVSRYTENEPLGADSIVRAAEHIIDQEGLGALTMRRLGRELGVEAMSIYHHIPNKATLEARLVTRLLATDDAGTSDAAPDITSDLTSDLLVEHYVRRLRSALHDHPGRLPLVTGRLPPELFDAAVPRSVVDSLMAAGFDPSASAWILDAVIGYVIGHALVEHSDHRATADDDEAAFETGLRFLLLGLRSDLGLS